ncbi:MAG: rhamnulokinase [Cetobacterium sp.]|uniref:rhamnulokinase n=1 Tax=Cetobacterium sp. TaxID=2071632 RepID=UPI003F31E544
MKSVLCLDLGASSGRAVIATYDNNNNLNLQEVHRFPTKTLLENEKTYWDFSYILKEIKFGIKKALEIDENIQSIGIDTWGCDYGWLDRDGNLLRNPRSYRTPMEEKILQEVHEKISMEDHYEICGNGHFSFNSIYQLYYDINYENILENGAQEFLFMPNLIFYHLTGKKIWEYTIASTSGLLNAQERNWSKTIFQKLNLPWKIKEELTYPNSTNYPLTEEIKKELNLNKNIEVVCVPGHDSACAILSTKLNEETGYLINGTWSLLGIETDRAITNSLGIKKGLVNEGSARNKIRFMSMIVGTWLLQSLRNQWREQGENIDFEDFPILGKRSSLEEYIEITEEFLNCKNMESLIKNKYFEKYNQEINSKEDILKITYNSLGNKYKESLELIKSLSNRNINNIVLLGGGNQDSFLIETIEKYLECPISLGPIEASVTGNALMQLKK